MSLDELRTAHPPTERPLLLHDDEHEPGRLMAERLRYQTGDRLDHAALHDAAERLPDVPREVLAGTISLVETDGRVLLGAAAIAAARARGDERSLTAWCVARVPGAALVAAWAWSVFSTPWVARAVRRLSGPDLVPRQHRLVRWLFLRLLGLTALCALVSMYVQLDGLIGAQGITPAHEYMDAAAEHAKRMEAAYEAGNPDGWSGVDRYLYVPTLLWMGAGDGWLHGIALLGIVLCVLLILDIAPGPSLLGIWLVYLSIITAGNVFLLYQWDTLLLETLFVAMFVAPWRRVLPRLGRDPEPSRAGLWLVRLLVFKLMFMSGVVKLLAEDVTWNELTALEYHYFTQPIPAWTSYYAHHLPGWLNKACVAVMFAVELALPFFLLGPRRLRIAAFCGFALLMLGIGLTGNYGFFNLLTVVACVCLLDDTALARLVPRRLASRVPDVRVRPRGPGPVTRAVVVACALPIVLVSWMNMNARLARGAERGELTTWALERTRSFHTINGYGLFASMTRTRPEIVIEGSRDGVTWEAYELPYKPGALERRPRFALLHMPRLDWQLWFAALRGCRGEVWLHAMLLKLLDGSAPVRALFEHDPFGAEPPRYLRTTRWLYTFTDPGQDGWWSRTLMGAYCPVVTLQNGQLVGVNL